ncbi:fluoride exporter, partial [Tremellales sp. Uapishka_1]
MGEHVSSFIPTLPLITRKRERHFQRSEPKTSSPTSSSSSHSGSHTPLVDLAILLSAVLCYLLVLLLYFLAPSSWRHRVLFPLLLSPPGAIVRFFLARLNTHSRFIDRFPMGTFIVNISATLIVAAVFALQRLNTGDIGATRCTALYGVQQGLCGCLSTVSTFVVEARTIKLKKWKWFYVFGSIVLGHLCVLAIVGGLNWDRGLGNACTA